MLFLIELRDVLSLVRLTQAYFLFFFLHQLWQGFDYAAEYTYN